MLTIRKMEKMQVKISEKEDNKCIVSIVIPKADVDAESDFIAKQMQPNVPAKGFRKGNTPLHVVKATYSKQIFDQVSQNLIVRGTQEALTNKGLKNVSNPELLEEFRAKKGKPYAGSFDLGGSFTFGVSVELPPDVTPKDYKGVEVEVPLSDFDEWLTAQMSEQQRTYGEKISTTRAVVSGDEVFIDFTGNVDGEAMEVEEGYRLIVGSKEMPDDFENSFLGRTKGEEFDVSVEFPGDSSFPKLSGKVCDFSCVLKDVFEIEPHELDDELAQMLSFNDLEDMNAGYRKKWESEVSDPLRAQLFNAISDKLLEANPFEAPEGWIRAEMSNTVQRLGASNFESSPQLLESIRGISERTVKIAYILDKIYEAELDIQLQTDEFQDKVADEASKIKMEDGTGMTAAQLITKLKEQGTYEGFVTYHEQQKVLDFLIENATIKEMKDND